MISFCLKVDAGCEAISISYRKHLELQTATKELHGSPGWVMKGRICEEKKDIR